MQPALEAIDRAVSAIPHECLGKCLELLRLQSVTQILLPKGAQRASVSHSPGLIITFALRTIALQTNWQIVTHMSEHLCVPAHGADNHFCLISSSIKEYVLTCQNGKGDDRGLSQWLSGLEKQERKVSNSRVRTGWAYLSLQIGVPRWERLIDHPIKGLLL